MGLAHDAGQLFGHVLNAAPGYSTLGANITNPNVNYKGALNPPTPSNNYYSPTTTQPKNDTDTNGNLNDTPPNLDGSASGGTSADATTNLFNLDSSIGQNQDALSRLDGQAATALSNIQNQYNAEYNKLLGQQAVVDRDYGTNKNQQLQDYQGARDNVSNNGRSLLLNTRRLLGGAGAGGGSADRYAAPNAVNQEVNANDAQVQLTNSRNLGALDTAYDDNKNKFQSGFSDLAANRDSSNRSTQSQFASQRAELLNNIAQLTGQKAIASGQSLQQAQAAANPFTSRIGTILSQIDALAANPGVVKANDIQLSTPDLAQYQWNRFAAPTQAPQDTSLSTPAINALLGLQDSNQRQDQLLAA